MNIDFDQPACTEVATCALEWRGPSAVSVASRMHGSIQQYSVVNPSLDCSKLRLRRCNKSSAATSFADDKCAITVVVSAGNRSKIVIIDASEMSQMTKSQNRR